jgi:hypothetical protein
VKNLAILAQIDTQKLQISDTLRIFEEFVGAKNYELSNHLGNVLATISDKTIFNTDHYNGIVYSAQLYYPFGWEIPTLSYTAKKYRFGFNGKEDDREWHAQDYGFRLYTPIQAVDLDGLEAFGVKLEKAMINASRQTALLKVDTETQIYVNLLAIYNKDANAKKVLDQYILNPNKENMGFAKGYVGQAMATAIHQNTILGQDYINRTPILIPVSSFEKYDFFEYQIVGVGRPDYILGRTPIPIPFHSSYEYHLNFNNLESGLDYTKKMKYDNAQGIVTIAEVKTNRMTQHAASDFIDGVWQLNKYTKALGNKGVYLESYSDDANFQYEYRRESNGIKSTVVPYLYFDKGAFFYMQKNHPDEHQNMLKAGRYLESIGGGVIFIENLNQNAENLLKKIEKTK